MCVCVCVCACGDDVKTLLLDTALIGYCMSWMMYDTVDLLVMEVMSCHVMSCRHCHCHRRFVTVSSPERS